MFRLCRPKNQICCNQMRFEITQSRKMRRRPSSARTPQGAYIASPNPIAGFKGPLRSRDGEGKWREKERKRKGKEEDGRGVMDGKGSGGEVDADWLRPVALFVFFVSATTA